MNRKMKKTFSLVGGLLALCISLSPFSSKAAYAEERAALPGFSDDFESYAADGAFIETDAAFAEKWSNNVLNGGEEQGIDAHLKGVGKIEYENGESGNKVLHLDNASVAMNSYFHIGPGGDYRVKNFTAGFRLKFLTEKAAERGWVGISFRKKAEAHYLGTNNLLFTVQRYTQNTEVSPHTYAVFNGGTTNDFSDAAFGEMFGEKLTFSARSYAVPNAVAGEDTPWMEYKLEAENNRYRMYLDGVQVADCSFEVNSFDYFGFLSLDCCTADILVDDFYVNVADTQLPPVIEKLPAPVPVWDEASKTLRWEKIAGANLYTVYLDGKSVKTSNKSSYQVEEELSEGEHIFSVKALSEDTFEALDSDLSAPVSYLVAKARDSSGGGGGCKSLAGAGTFSALALLAAGFALKKRE